jgi:hypothetical protein
MTHEPKPPLQLSSTEWIPIDNALQCIRLHAETLAIHYLQRDVQDGRYPVARHGFVLRATDHDGDANLFFRGQTTVEGLVSREESEAFVFDTIEAANKAALRLNWLDEWRRQLSFEPKEICELCERSYLQTITLTESKNGTCRVYMGSRPQGRFYVGLAEFERCYPAAGQHDEKQAPPPQKPEHSQKTERSRALIREIAAELYPNGYDHIEDKPLFKDIADKAKKSRGIDLDPVRQRATFRRALGRRKDKPRGV